MAAGIPVIASENAGYEEEVPIKIVGINSSKEWTKSLTEMMGDKDQRQSFRERAYQWVQSRTWENIATQYETEYMKVIN